MTAEENIKRLQAKVTALGGTIPAPWPWAVTRKWGKKIQVDAPLYQLQLLELVEDLERKTRTWSPCN